MPKNCKNCGCECHCDDNAHIFPFDGDLCDCLKCEHKVKHKRRKNDRRRQSTKSIS